MTRIAPSIARNLWFYPPAGAGRHEDGEPFAAILAGVNADGTVNLLVAARDGSPYGVQNVRLVQDLEEFDASAAYATWMPYQKGQAARTDSAEGAAASKVAALEQATEGKFLELGKYLEQKFGSIEQRLNAMPPAQPPAPPTPAPAQDGAGEAGQQQPAAS